MGLENGKVAIGLGELEAEAELLLLLLLLLEEELLGATRSQEGHMVKVVAGNCMKKGFEFEAFKALNS